MDPLDIPMNDNQPKGMSAGLYVVSTPIGNLADITYRAVDTLKSVTLVAAEDTRHSQALFRRYAIETPCIAYHEHNEARETPRLVAKILNGDSIALISDAGTPLLSDPGSRLVSGCIEAGVSVFPVPGASALLSALVAGGIPSDQFTFLGFPERKGKARAELLEKVISSTETVVLYESPNRIKQLLLDFADAGAANRNVVVARELTKLYETFYRGTVEEVIEKLPESVKGEVVLVMEGKSRAEVTEEELHNVALNLKLGGLPAREIVARLVNEYGARRNVAYRMVHGN